MADESLTLTIVLILVTLLLAVFCVFTAEKRMKPLQYREQEIPNFSVQLRHKPYTAAVELGNRYDCNAKSLRECLTDDVTTLLGCKELTVRCHHFDKDTNFHNDGDVSVIPKNKAPNEGYALSIAAIVDACNPFHGDPVLISAAVDSGDYVLGCRCKNPGYIGSENVLDSCTTVHICGGKIDDVNQPLAKINCLCDVTETAVRYGDGLPVCKPLTVLEANNKFDDWSHIVPWSSGRLIDKRVFNATVRDNLKTSRLLDPCSNSLTDATQPIPGAYYNEALKTCFYKDYGLPVRTGALEQHKDAGKSTTVDGALPSGRHKYLRLIDKVGGKRKIVNVRTTVNLNFDTGGPSDRETEVNVTLPAPLGIGQRAQFSLSTADQMLGGRCTGSWPSYDCVMTEYFSHNVFGVPKPGYRAPPGAFLWATEHWDNAERMVSSGLLEEETGVVLNNEYLDAIGDNMRYYGIKLCHKDEVECYNGVISFNNKDDYSRHHNILT